MRPLKLSFYFFIITVLGSSLYISVSNTWKWTSDFYGLVVLVSVSEEDRSYNPYSNDFLWVSQDMAVSIIKTMDYPFERCSSVSAKLGACGQPTIEYAGRFIGMVGPEAESKIFEILNFLIQRGDPVNAYNLEGYTALHSAILGNSPKLVSLLLESGADPLLPIKREGKFLGKNSYEFIEILSGKNQEEFSELSKLFNEKLPNQALNRTP